jgi:N-acetylneuraminic acid mutarotase
MARARTGASAAAFQGRVLVVGGAVSDNALSSIEIYDPSSDSWSPAPPMSSPRTAHVVAVLEEKLLIFGGASSSNPAALGVLSEIETIQLGVGGR